MTAALGSGSAPLPSLPQPWARVLPLVPGSAASPFEATSQPCNGPPEIEDLRPIHRYMPYFCDSAASRYPQAELLRGTGWA